jgi:hypothetical protein
MKKLTLENKTDILAGVFFMALIAANLLGGKITTIFGIAVSVSIFTYPLTFLATDIIAEVHGKQKSYSLIMAGMICLLLLLLITYLSIILPANARYPYNDSYVTIFQTSIRFIIASVVAFVLAQFHDVWSFHFWKQKTHGKFLWLRNNASTFVSQFIDTVVFMFIAFYQVAPKFTFGFIWQLIIPYFLFKIAFAIIDTPFVYLGVNWLKKSKN